MFRDEYPSLFAQDDTPGDPNKVNDEVEDNDVEDVDEDDEDDDVEVDEEEDDE